MLTLSRPTINKLFGFVAIGVLLFSGVSSLFFSGTAEAAGYSTLQAADRIKAADGYKILGLCLNQSGQGRTLHVATGKATDPSTWTLPSTTTGSSDLIAVPPYYSIVDYQGDIVTGGKMNCNAFFANYAAALGITDDPAAFLTDAGYIFGSGSSATFKGCTTRTGGTQLVCLQQAIRNRLGITSAPVWDAQMYYVRNKTILDAQAKGNTPGGCYAHWSSQTANSGTFSISSWVASHGGSNPDKYLLGTVANPTIITLVDNAQAPTTTKDYIVMSEGGDGSDGWEKAVLISPDFTNSVPSSDRAQCKTLAQYLDSTYTAAYIQWATANPELNNGTGTGSDTAGTTPDVNGDDCPLDSGESLRWLGCSIFYTFQNAAQKITALLDEYLFTDPTMFNETAQKAATVFRNVGMVLIVVAGLIMVISQALGFEFLDAYTIRKLMPRLGIALIGMAISWPLLKLAVTLTNDLGGLVYSVFMLIPSAAGATGSSSDVGTGIGVALVSILGVGASVFAIGMLASLSFIGTILLGLLVAFLVLTIRQLIIFMVILLAPLAIAAYVIPGGEKLWKFWKNTLITTLFMYPLIMGFLGAGAAMSYLIDSASLGAQSSILAILVYFAPFFMIPFAFKMAGGLMSTIFSMVNDKNRGGFDRLKKARGAAFDARMEHRGNRVKRAVTERQASVQRGLKDYSSRSGKVGKFLANRGISALNGYQGNLEARMSAYQAAGSKELNDQIATGMDDEIRGLTVNKKEALRRAAKGDRSLFRIGDKGQREFKTLGGAWVSEASVDAGHKRWGSDTHAQQAALSYEMRKANSEADVDGISSRYASIARGDGGWGMTERQAESAWIGSSFENQNQHLEFKKTNWKTGELGSGGYQSLVDEVYEKKGSYPLSQMHSRTIERLKQAYDDADQIDSSHQIVEKDGSTRTATADEIALARDRKEKVRSIAETFMHDAGITRGDDGAPVAAGETVDASGRRIVSGQGAAHTNERVWELAEMTGARAAEASGPYAGPSVHTQVPSVNPAADTSTLPNQQRQHG